MTKIKIKKCRHKFEIIYKRYDHWDELDAFVMYCSLCGEVRKVEIEGRNVYVNKGKGGEK